MPKLGVFGGTFDPVHWGHLQVARVAQHQLGLDGVLWVPTRTPWGKQATDFSRRCQGVQLAIAPYGGFQLQRMEDPTPNQDYAVFTFQSLQRQFPQAHWCWILGEDLWPTLPRWYGREGLIPQCEWAIAPRPFPDEIPINACTQVSQFDPKPVMQQLTKQGITIRWQWLQMTPISVSSRQIRHAYQQSQPWQHLVPQAVADWIVQEDLYHSVQTDSFSDSSL